MRRARNLADSSRNNSLKGPTLILGSLIDLMIEREIHVQISNLIIETLEQGVKYIQSQQ